MEHDIGCKIKAARIEKKLTQEQVAELLGVSRQTISNWENEERTPGKRAVNPQMQLLVDR